MALQIIPLIPMLELLPSGKGTPAMLAQLLPQHTPWFNPSAVVPGPLITSPMVPSPLSMLLEPAQPPVISAPACSDVAGLRCDPKAECIDGECRCQFGLWGDGAIAGTGCFAPPPEDWGQPPPAFQSSIHIDNTITVDVVWGLLATTNGGNPYTVDDSFDITDPRYFFSLFLP